MKDTVLVQKSSPPSDSYSFPTALTLLGPQEVLLAGFPPIREFRENFEDFFQSGKSGKTRGFSAQIR